MGTADTDTIKTPGLHLTLRAGDVVVHPVGTAHSNISDSGGYSYLAFFPDGSPRWKSENGATAMMDVQAARGEMMLGVPIPGDPVTGGEGELGRVWGAEMERYIRTHTHTHTHAHAHTRGGYKL